MTANTFALALLTHRERLGLTQAQMAAALELTPRIYWGYEHGRVEPAKIAQEGAIARLKRMSPKAKKSANG